MRKAILTALTTTTLMFAGPAAAEIKMIGKYKVGFEAEGPGGLEIPGKAKGFSVKETDGNVVFTVDMTQVTTGIKLRDAHMCDKYAHCGDYPTATLTIERAALPIPLESATTITVDGVFNAHGVDQPTKVELKIAPGKNGFDVTGGFDFNTEKHGIEIPSYLGVTADPDMKAHAKFTLVDV